MTHDDIVLDHKIQFPIECWVQEKVDGANCGVAWTSGPVLRNRSHILNKGYIEKETPAKLQFRSAWNWLHDHGKEIRSVSDMCHSPVTIYGEWLVAKHSIEYDRLPDWFVSYDIYSMEDRKFLSPDISEDILSKTSIKFIKPYKVIFNNIDEVVEYSERPSDYRKGIREGIVIKLSDGKFVTESFKVVNKYFVRRNDFNEAGLIKNRILA